MDTSVRKGVESLAQTRKMLGFMVVYGGFLKWDLMGFYGGFMGFYGGLMGINGI